MEAEIKREITETPRSQNRLKDERKRESFVSALLFRGIPPGTNLGCLVKKPWEGGIMSVGFAVSFFNQINHDLTENNFCLLMASPAFEVPQGKSAL